MQKMVRSSVGIILACCVAQGIAACDSGADRPTDHEEGSRSHQESIQESRAAWLAFQRSVHEELEPIARELENVGKNLSEFEKREVDHWAERVKRAREEIAKEMEEAPEKRRRHHEEIRRELDEIKSGVATLLAKLGIGKAPSTDDESPE